MNVITLQRNSDNGYGVVSCIQKQDFEISNIHEYFKDALKHTNHSFNFGEPFKDALAVANFLNENWDEIWDGAIMTDLDPTDIFDYFLSTCNPNGSGNMVDSLVLTYDGKVLFQSVG